MMNRGETMAKEKETEKEEVTEEVVDEQTNENEEKQDENTTESLEKQMKKLEEEVNTWKTDYYKVFADMENLKRRLEKEHLTGQLSPET